MSSYNKGMNNGSNKCGNCGTTCSQCGRPWAICKQDGGCKCNKCGDVKFCEYGKMANGCIREKQPGCPMQAVIPSVTIESIEGIKNLADCLVHVSDINTTFYIDDKHRPIVTWAGLISVSGYDVEANPKNFRGQVVYDTTADLLIVFDSQGVGHTFNVSETTIRSVVLPAAAWSNEAPYTQTVSLSGVTKFSDLSAPYLSYDATEAEDEALACISGGMAGAGEVAFYCYDEKPATTITVYMVDKGTSLAEKYPIASETNIGMIEVGDGLSVSNDGVIAVEIDSDLSDVSEKPVQNKKVTLAINSLNDRLTTAEGDIDDIRSEQHGIFAMSREQGSNRYGMLYSENGKDFYQVGKMLSNNFGHDASSLIEINGVYYYISSNYYRYSTDLVNWSNDNIIEEGGSSSISADYATGWGTMFYYDEENELVYAYYARTYNQDTVTAANGASTRYFKISYQTGTINTNGSITFSQDIHDLLYTEGESYIDPYVIKHETLGYLIAYKDEIESKIQISTMTSLTQMGTTTNICPIQGIEAPKLIQDEQKNVICYFDGYSIGNKTLLNNNDNYPNLSGYFYAVVNGSLRANYQMGAIPCSYAYKTRHVGYMKTSSKLLYDIKKLGITSFPTLTPKIDNMFRDNGKGYYLPADGSTIVNFPNVIYNLAGTRTLTIKNYFKDEPLRFVLSGSAVITWSNDSWIQTFLRGKTLSGSSNRHCEFFQAFPDARNCLDGMFIACDNS